MTNPRSLRQRAQAGDPQAITALMNQSFQPQGIRATAIANGPELNIYLDAETVPDRRLSQRIRQGLTALGVTQYSRIVVHGRQLGTENSDWSNSIMVGGEVSSSAPAQRPAVQRPAQRPAAQLTARSPNSQRTTPPRTSRTQQRASTVPTPVVPPRSPLQSLSMMTLLLIKWVFFSFLVCLIPTLILMAFFGLIPLAIYLGVLGVIWSRIQTWVLRPYWGDRAGHWQDPTQWGFIAGGGIVLAIRFLMPLVWRWLPLTDQMIWGVGGGIVVGVTALGYLLGKLQAPCFEPPLHDHGPALPPGCRWWGLANAGLGGCVGANLTLTYLSLSNPSLLYNLRLGLITLFPAVLIYLIGTGLVLAYCLEIEQRQRLAATATTNAEAIASLPAIPGLESFGRIPLALPFFGVAVIPVALLTTIMPTLGFLTLMVFWLFAYQVGSWLQRWAFVAGLVAMVVTVVPYVGFAVLSPAGLGRFAVIGLMATLGTTVVSFALGAIAGLLSRSWRTAGGMALLGPSLSFALTGLMVLAAL